MADIRASLVLDTKKAEKNVNKVGTALKALASAAVAKEILDLSNIFQNLNNRLLAVTDSEKSYAQAQQDVRDIAQSTRSSLAATGDLYASLTIASEDLGLKQSQVAQITETFSKTLKISGAETGAAAGAMIQFGQALASGVLRGDEFNSINETNSKFMGEFANILGVTRGELRKLAEEGVLTADLMAEATQIMADRVDEAFDKTNATIGEAFGQIQNALVGLFGKLNEETGAFDSLSASLIKLADAINNLESSSVIGFFKDLLYYAVALFSIFGVGKLIKGITSFQGSMINMGKAVRGAKNDLKGFDRIGKNFGESMAGFRNAFGKGGADAAGGRIGALGTGVAGLGRVFARFLPFVGAAMIALDAFNFVLRKITGGKDLGDFLAGPTTAVLDFGKGLFGLETSVEKAMRKTKELEEQLAKQEADKKARADKQAKEDEETKALREKLKLARKKEAEEKRQAAEKKRAEKALADLIARNEQTAKESLLTQAESLSQSLKELELQKELMLLGKDEAETKKMLTDLDNERLDAIAKISSMTFSDDEQKNAELLAQKIAKINELYAEQIPLIQAAKEANDEQAKAFSTGITQGFNDFVAMVEDQAAYAQNIFSTITKGFEDSIVNFVKTGKLSFKDLFQSLMTEIIKMQANKLFLSLLGLGGGLGGLFAGFFNNGGNIPGGKFGIAGERGPEIIKGPATVTSTADTAALLSGRNTSVTYNINAVDAASFKQMVAQDPEFIYNVSRAGARRTAG